jgi:hypothetical protein
MGTTSCWKALSGIAVLAAPLIAAPASAAQGEAVDFVVPAIAPEDIKMSVYARHSATSDIVDEGSFLLRRPGVRSGRNDLPSTDLPEEWTSDLAGKNISARLNVSLNEAGEMTDCTGHSMSVGSRSSYESDLDLPISITRHACFLAKEHLSFSHALDASGRPVASKVRVAISALHKDYSFLPPAPPPPPSWVVQKDNWPPRYFYAGQYRYVRFERPDGAQFVARDRNRPRKAQVDVLLSSDESGKITSCDVAVPSGVSDYDDVTCTAIESEKQAPYLRNFPLRVLWNKQRLRFRLPSDANGPELVRDVMIDSELLSDLALERIPRMRAILTVSPQGRLQHCQLDLASNIDELDRRTCALFGPDTDFIPARNHFGDKAQGKIAISVNWKDMAVRKGWY